MQCPLFILLFLPLLAFVATAEAQTRDYMSEGNRFLSLGQSDRAEEVFREAIQAEPDQADAYRSQLALSLIQQEAFDEADTVLDSLLLEQPGFPPAMWYRALNSQMAGEYREAVSRFQDAIPVLEAAGQAPQVWSAYFFIGESYRELLQSEGLSYGEGGVMLDAYERYLALAPPDESTPRYRELVARLRANRPPANVKRWIYIH